MGFTFPWPKRVLMVTPEHFRVDYAINAYMLDSNGNLQNIDRMRACHQWEDLKNTFTRLGLSVETLPGEPDLPDMVFCANQTLPFLDSQDRMNFILSRMHSDQRKGEVRFFREWAEARDIRTWPVTDFDFEGAGDAIWNYERRELLGGHGFRTHSRVYDEIEKLTGVKVHRLKLVSENFYHMDTCLSVLRGDTVAYVPEAFDDESRGKIAALFTNRIEIDLHEAKHHFSGNCLSVDGRHVVLQSGATRFTEALKANGFVPVEVDTSEFLKSGGSVFCLKQLLF